MANEKIVIEFAVEGVQALKGVFDSLEQRMVRFDRAATQSTERSSRARVQSTRGEAASREKEYAKLARDSEKWEKQFSREVDREAKNRAKAVEAEEKRKLAIRENSMRMAQQLLEREVREEKRAADEKVRIAESAAKREAAVSRQYRSRITGAMGGGLSSFGSMGSRMIGAGMALGGGFTVANAMRSSMTFDRAVAQASNMAYIPGQTTRAQAAPERIASLARGVQATTNIDKTEAANAFRQYVALSSDVEGMAAVDKKTGRTNLQEMAIMSKASGTDFGQLIQAAASVKAGNADMTPEMLATTMRGLIGAGKKGTIPLDQLASHVGEIQATASRLAGGDTAAGLALNQNKLLGFTQLIGKATGGDAAEAATAVRHLTGDFSRHGAAHGMTKDMLYAGGDSGKGMLDPADLMANLFKVTGGKLDKAQKILGDRSIKAYDALAPVYQAAEAKKAGSGVEAVRAKVLDTEDNSYSAAETMKDFAQVMQTNGEKIESSMKLLEEVVERRATPFLEKFAKDLADHEPQIEKLLGALADVAEFMVSHPWQSMFMAMEAELLKSVASAAIGEAIKKSMVSGTTTGFTAAAPLAAPIIAAAMALAIQLGIAAIDKVASHAAGEQGAAATGGAQALSLAARIRRGAATPAEVEEAKRLQGQLTNLVDTGDRDGSDAHRSGHHLAQLAAGAANAVGFSGPQEQMARESAGLTTALNELKKAFEEAAKRGPLPGAPGAGDAGRPGSKPQSHAPMSDSSRGGLQH